MSVVSESLQKDQADADSGCHAIKGCDRCGTVGPDGRDGLDRLLDAVNAASDDAALATVPAELDLTFDDALPDDATPLDAIAWIRRQFPDIALPVHVYVAAPYESAISASSYAPGLPPHSEMQPAHVAIWRRINEPEGTTRTKGPTVAAAAREAVRLHREWLAERAASAEMERAERVTVLASDDRFATE